MQNKTDKTKTADASQNRDDQKTVTEICGSHWKRELADQYCVTAGKKYNPEILAAMTSPEDAGQNREHSPLPWEVVINYKDKAAVRIESRDQQGIIADCSYGFDAEANAYHIVASVNHACRVEAERRLAEKLAEALRAVKFSLSLSYNGKKIAICDQIPELGVANDHVTQALTEWEASTQ